MTVTTSTLGGRRGNATSLSGHPELVAVPAVVAAWVFLLVFASRAVGGGMSQSMPGMPMPGTPGLGPWAEAVAALPSWLLMTVAMMGPAALGEFRALARAGLATVRASAAFGGVYLAIWAAFGLLAEAAATAIRGVPSPQALAVCLAVATAWQLTPLKHRVLRGCLGATPAEVERAAARPSAAPAVTAQPSLPVAARPAGAQPSLPVAARPAGAQPPAAGRATSPCGSHQPAAAVALRRGLRFGLCCVGTCWCLMLVPLAAPGGQLPWMAGLTILISAERLASAGRGADPRSASRAVARTAAGALAVAAFATLAVSGLLQ